MTDTDSQARATDKLVRSRTIPASPEAVFSVLSDPTQHPDTEPTDWVRAALDPAPITEVGQIFGMEMFHVGAGGRYEIHNRVIAFEPGRTIAWQPGQFEGDNWGSGGWRWRYDLTPADDGTEVTLTYDWSQVSPETREQFGGFPVVPAEFLDESLAALDRHVQAQR